MCSAVVADVATAAERGKYMGFTLAGSLLGPAIGPVIGGVLAQFLGWRAIFWFLTIMGSAFIVVFAVFFPETGAIRSTKKAPRLLIVTQLEIKSGTVRSHQKVGTCL